jgi:hypothetical protein
MGSGWIGQGWVDFAVKRGLGLGLALVLLQVDLGFKVEYGWLSAREIFSLSAFLHDFMLTF